MTTDHNPMTDMQQWIAARLIGGPGEPPPQLPFSFLYGGESFATLLDPWAIEYDEHRLDAQRTEHELIFTDPASGLVVTCRAVAFHDFPAVEWTVYFRNTGTEPTPILSDIQAIDAAFPGADRLLLHHHKGDNCTPDSYAPLLTELAPGVPARLACTGGRPTQTGFPFFNVERGGEAASGVIVVFGWPGQWAATFEHAGAGGLHVRGGQERTHFRLLPGEEARTPRAVLMFWEDDRSAAQNAWRRWMLAHNTPKLHAQDTPPLLTACAGGFFEGLKCNEVDERRFIDRYTAEGLQLAYWWMDAGWYPCQDWTQVGTWEVDAERFPHGLRAISDHAHSHDMGLIVWFEPERVAPDTWLAGKTEWLLAAGDGGDLPAWARRWRLLDLGNDEARAWLVEQVDRLLVKQGIDFYRQDFNIDPLPFWRAADTEERQGLAENHYVTGYLAYWDELRRRHPGMLIDSCASGGRRNDIETLRRAVPLLRSDYQSFAGDPAYAPGNQGHTYGLSSWMPYYGQGVYFSAQDFAYSARSYLSPGFGVACDVRRDDVDWDAVRKVVRDWQAVAALMLADYHPLTSYSLDEDRWMAWQFDDPQRGIGAVQAFRRKDAVAESACFPLHALAAGARYAVTNAEGGEPAEYTGRELMEHGLTVILPMRPAAAILLYRRIS
jgi:alpha-galactosidase